MVRLWQDRTDGTSQGRPSMSTAGPSAVTAAPDPLLAGLSAGWARLHSSPAPPSWAPLRVPMDGIGRGPSPLPRPGSVIGVASLVPVLSVAMLVSHAARIAVFRTRWTPGGRPCRGHRRAGLRDRRRRLCQPAGEDHRRDAGRLLIALVAIKLDGWAPASRHPASGLGGLGLSAASGLFGLLSGATIGGGVLALPILGVRPGSPERPRGHGRGGRAGPPPDQGRRVRRALCARRVGRSASAWSSACAWSRASRSQRWS